MYLTGSNVGLQCGLSQPRPHHSHNSQSSILQRAQCVWGQLVTAPTTTTTTTECLGCMDFIGLLYLVAARTLRGILAPPLRLLGLPLTILQPRLLTQAATHTQRLYHYQSLQVAIMELKGRIVVFSIVGCPHCMRAKSSLQELGLPYTNISLDTYPTVRQWVRDKTGKSTVPQVFFNATYVGGNEELQKLVSACLNGERGRDRRRDRER